MITDPTDKWQTTLNAPEYVSVLLWSEDTRTQAVGHLEYDEDRTLPRWHTLDGDYDFELFTHWSPLRAGPKVTP